VLGCNIHDQMVAWIVVVDTPYFAKSDVNGVADLKNLPAGDYQLASWYPAPTFEPKIQALHIPANGSTPQISLSMDVAGSPLPALKNAP
jgi:hypothetical protein